MQKRVYQGKMDVLERFHSAVLNDSVDTVKELLHDGLSPNAVMEGCSCENHVCNGYTLLYMACEHDKMNIVRILLAARADPERYNRSTGINKQTPFYYAIKTKNIKLMRLLLRDNKARVPTVHKCSCHRHLSYSMFGQFHDDRDAVVCIINTGLFLMDFRLAQCPFEPLHPNLSYFLYIAARSYSRKLCTFLVSVFGLETVLGAIRQQKYIVNFERKKYDVVTMAFLIEVFGARYFVDNRNIKLETLLSPSRSMTQLMMRHCYKLHGDSKAWWQKRLFPAGKLFVPNSVCEFTCLLRWGAYSVLPDLPHTRPHTRSLFFTLAKSGHLDSIDVLVSLHPQYLQEIRLLEGCKPWTPAERKSVEQEREEYFAALAERSQQVPDLKLLCRSVIFHQLGINPILKAEFLPLSRKLKNFVQCRELRRHIRFVRG